MVDVWGGTDVCLTIQMHWQGLSWHSMDQSKMSGDIFFLFKNTPTYTCATEVKVNPFSEGLLLVLLPVYFVCVCV